MIDWMARAKAQFGQCGRNGTAKTDESPLSSVSSVRPAGFAANDSSVSTTADGVVAGAEPGATVAPAATRSSGNPYMTPEQGDECHTCGWDDAEIAMFTSRERRFALAGRADAGHLAERLTLRDRQSDDRGICLECRELESSGRCAAARRGELANADRRLEPVPNLLMRCEGFDAAVFLLPIPTRR